MGTPVAALPPADLLLQVEQEIAKLILANAEVLAKRCAETCVQQVWAAAAAQVATPTPEFPKKTEADSVAEPELPKEPEAPVIAAEQKADSVAEPELPKEPEAPVIAAEQKEQPEAPMEAFTGDEEDPWDFFLQADVDAEAKVKGKTKGKGKGPPLPAKAASRAVPKTPPVPVVRRNSGICELKARVEAEGQRKDREEAKEISDVDLSQITTETCERVTCSRCEQDVPKEHLESHLTAHSSEILPGLYLGGKRNLENDKELTVRTQITHVLNLAQEVNLKEDIRTLLTEYQAQRGLEFVYKKVGLGDTPDENILKDMDSILDFIHQARSSEQHHILVNCVQGISRSAAVVLAYLMKFEEMSLRDAYHFLRHRRSIADPRKEFLQQLGKLECELFNLSTPTLNSDLAFAGRHMLNLDDAPMPVPQKDVQDPEMRHELEALQKVLQNLNHAVQNIGAEAEAASEAVKAIGKDAGVIAQADDSITNMAQRYASSHRHLEVPELHSEREACEALVDYMKHAAFFMLDQRDHFRRQAEDDSHDLHQQGSPAPVRPIVVPMVQGLRFLSILQHHNSFNSTARLRGSRKVTLTPSQARPWRSPEVAMVALAALVPPLEVELYLVVVSLALS
eukprot:symbB.v1.2.008354.t3/scaffold524.1/size192337/3